MVSDTDVGGLLEVPAPPLLSTLVGGVEFRSVDSDPIPDVDGTGALAFRRPVTDCERGS